MKQEALFLLKLAAALFPPLARLLGEVLDSVSQDHPDRELVDEVREILPSEGPIHDAVRTLRRKTQSEPE